MAALGLVVLVVAVIALQQPHQTATTAGTTTPSAQPTVGHTDQRSTASRATGSHSPARSGPSAGHPTGARRRALALIVLNASGHSGLADQAKQRLQRGGWTVTSTDDNYVNRIISTAAYFDPTVPSAKAVALRLQRQYPTIKRVLARFPELPRGPIVLVLTTDYSPN